MNRFTWTENTITYFADLEEANGWAHCAKRMLEFVTYECDLEPGETVIDLFSDLAYQVEEAINTSEYEWIEAKLTEEKDLD